MYLPFEAKGNLISNMSRLYYLTAFFAGVLLFFSSCSKSDNEKDIAPGGDIVGDWMYFEKEAGYVLYIEAYRFTKDGKFYMREYGGFDEPDDYYKFDHTVTGTYAVKNNTFTVTQNVDDLFGWYNVGYSISGKKLILCYDGHWVTDEVYERVSSSDFDEFYKSPYSFWKKRFSK